MEVRAFGVARGSRVSLSGPRKDCVGLTHAKGKAVQLRLRLEHAGRPDPPVEEERRACHVQDFGSSYRRGEVPVTLVPPPTEAALDDLLATVPRRNETST